jgi:hypothetical protein
MRFEDACQIEPSHVVRALSSGALIGLVITIASCGAAGPPTNVPLDAAAKSSAVASDTAPIAQPSLHSGDVWVDRIQGADREFRIDSVHGDTMEVSYWGAQETTDCNLNIIVYRSLTESSSQPSVSSKPGMWFTFPLYAGKTWVNDFDWQMGGAAPVTGKGEDRGRAIGWEDIQVPAGTYRAMKVEVVSRYYGKGGMADEETATFWYSPKVNRFVKFEYTSFYEGELVAELVKYRPARRDN